MNRAQLEELALQKMSQTMATPSSSIDRAALEKMALEKMTASGMTEIDPKTEASLGFINRAKYSLEPIQSNRKALLEQQFGQDNIMEDKNGELFVRQNNKFVPVNKDGFSTADVTDFAGAIPEMAGGIAGGAAGVAAGLATSGGLGSVPMAIITGAAGAGAGSAIRQGLSAAVGTPQVASLGERALETGLSTAIGGAASGAGAYLKPVAMKAKNGITEIIKNLGKQTIDSTSDNATKSAAKTTINATMNLVPEYSKKTASEIMGEVANQSGRDVVQAEMKNLGEIAARQGLPLPTYAQAAGGKALIAEAKVMDTPLIGGKVRKQVDNQLKLIKDNLEKITGKFIDADSDAFEVGLATREYAETSVSAVKKVASELYSEVEELGQNAMIGKSTFFNKFRDYAGELGVINPDLSPSKYMADSGLTRNEFNTIQEALFDGINAIKENPSSRIRFESVNALRKTINGVAEELKDKNPNSARLLKKFGKELDLTTERVLNREHPKLGEKFREANKNWAKYKDQEETIARYFKQDMGDEKVVKAIMSNSVKIAQLKEIIGEDKTKEIGKSYVRDILEKLGKSGIGRADSALNEIKKNRAQIMAALGEDTYKNLIDNLHYLNRTGQPLGVARASLYNIFDNRGAGIKQIGLNMVGAAKTVTESKGTTITKAAKDKAIETTGKIIPISPKGFSKAGNILTDDKQRNLSALTSYKNNTITEKEKEIEKRKRAISGGRP